MTKRTTNKLSDTQLKKAKPKNKLYRLRDGGGLYCEVLTTGARVWRYAYRFGEARPNKAGKLIKPEKTFTIGTYPDIGLKQARKMRDEAREKVSAGIDPSAEKRHKKRVLSDDSFSAIAESWYTHNVDGWSASHSKRVRGALNRYILPNIGRINIENLEAPEIIPIIEEVVGRGSLDTAARVKGYVQQVFDYAVAYGHVRRNPARDINTRLIIPPRIKEHFSAITTPNEAGELLRRIDAHEASVQVKTALQLAPLFWLRPAELAGAEWDELDMEARRWVLPARRRKLPTHIKKADRPGDALIVPLADQAIALIENLRNYTGHTPFLFPSPQKHGAPINPESLRAALRSLGYSREVMTTHGFRSMARTMLEALGYPEKLLELQLGHKYGSAVQQAYDRFEGLEQRAEIMQAWADYLDALKAGGDVVPFKKRA